MAEVTIEATPNGPYLVTGAIDLRDVNGRILPTKGKVWLCRCEASTRKPLRATIRAGLNQQMWPTCPRKSAVTYARSRPGSWGRGAMASTNEDVVILATGPLDDGRRLLIIRHLPDRGTVEIGWWNREEGGAIMPEPSVLELAAEAVEITAVGQLCKSLLAGVGWDAASNGEALARTTFADGAQIEAVRSGNGMMLVRYPEGDNLVLPSRAALGLLSEIFPVAQQKLETLGFGLVQQGDQAIWPKVAGIKCWKRCASAAEGSSCPCPKGHDLFVPLGCRRLPSLRPAVTRRWCMSLE